MKYLISIAILFLFASNCYSQTLVDDTDTTSKHVMYIFKNSSGEQVITRNLISRSIDIDSMRSLSNTDFHKKFKNTRAVAGVYVFFKPEAKMLELVPLLQHFKIAVDPSQFMIQLDNERPVHQKNLYVIVQAIKAIKLDMDKKIIQIAMFPDKQQ